MKQLSYFVVGAVSLLALVACTNSEKGAKIEFEKLAAERQIACPDDANVNCFDVHVALEFPKKSDNKSMAMIRSALITDLFGEKYVDVENHELLKTYVDDCYTEFELTAGEIEDFPATNFYAEDLKSVPLYVGENLLTYEATRYMYTGGAHGVTSTLCWVFDLENGQQLTEDDIFVPNAVEQLEVLLRQALSSEATNMGASLDDFYLDQLQPNGNFAVTEEGFYYQFNPYDIAPYAVGSVRLLLTKEQLQPLMRTDSPVYATYFGK